MNKLTVQDINKYVGTTVNPLNSPNTVYELYSVPSFDSDYPEIIKGCEIGSSKVTVEENDVLVCKINPRINRVWIVKHHTSNQLIASSEWVIVRSPENNPRYLMYYFQSPTFRTYINSGVTGIGGSLTRAQPKHIATYPVPIPTIDKQNRITTILDKLQSIITHRKQQLEKLDLLVKSRFVEMFGDPITNPMKWKKEETNKHIDLLSGYPFKSDQYVEEGINICGGLIIMPQRIEWESCVHWPTVQGYEDYLLEDGDIVMALDRPWITEGFKVARVDGNHLPALLIQRTARIRALDINQDYLYYCFINGGFDKHSNVTGSLVPHISARDIRSFEIMVPPIELQEEFSKFMKQVDKSKFVVQQALEKAQLLFDSLMQEYFG